MVAPSPPLLPLPQQTRALLPLTEPKRCSAASTVRAAAFSISRRLGTRYTSVVRRSTSPICAAINIFITGDDRRGGKACQSSPSQKTLPTCGQGERNGVRQQGLSFFQ